MPKILFASALLAAAFPLPVAASSPRESETIAVNFADLDLATPEGVARLDRRIASAVHWLCGAPYISPLFGQRAVRQCREETLASAADQRRVAILGARSRSRRTRG